MNIKVVFEIGKDARPMNAPPFRAFVYWLSQGKLLKANDFSEIELVNEIERLKKDQVDEIDYMAVLEDALTALRKSNPTKANCHEK